MIFLCMHVLFDKLRTKSLPVYFNDFCTENTEVHNHYTKKKQ